MRQCHRNSNLGWPPWGGNSGISLDFSYYVENMTDVRLKKLLMQRSTVYKDISTDVVEELGKLAKDMRLETKKLVGLFDKFMTVSRQSNTSVCLEDVDAFAREQAVLLSKSKAKSVFAKTEWDECVYVFMMLMSSFHWLIVWCGVEWMSEIRWIQM